MAAMILFYASAASPGYQLLIDVGCKSLAAKFKTPSLEISAAWHFALNVSFAGDPRTAQSARCTAMGKQIEPKMEVKIVGK